MDDSKSRFWEQLIADWVIVAVLAFMLQGLWFGAGRLLVAQSPGLESTLDTFSARLGVPWLLAIAGGFTWGAFRAFAARRRVPSPR